jgi:uncharacterized Zn-finger protein
MASSELELELELDSDLELDRPDRRLIDSLDSELELDSLDSEDSPRIPLRVLDFLCPASMKTKVLVADLSRSRTILRSTFLMVGAPSHPTLNQHPGVWNRLKNRTQADCPSCSFS